MEVPVPDNAELYQGWKVFRGPDHPVTGIWRADKSGVQMSAGTELQIRLMVREKAREEVWDRVRRYYQNNPFMPYKTAAKALGISQPTLRDIHAQLQDMDQVQGRPDTKLPDNRSGRHRA